MPPVGGGDPTGGSNATPLAAFLLAGAEAETSVVVAVNSMAGSESNIQLMEKIFLHHLFLYEIPWKMQYAQY